MGTSLSRLHMTHSWMTWMEAVIGQLLTWKMRRKRRKSQRRRLSQHQARRVTGWLGRLQRRGLQPFHGLLPKSISEHERDYLSPSLSTENSTGSSRGGAGGGCDRR